MTAPGKRAVGLPLVAALGAVLLAGCGGFGTKEPETLDTAITSYVALGDGFTAAPYVGKRSGDDGCLRSADNYPAQVAKALSVTDFTDVSCAGATTKAITDGFKPAGAKKKLKAQLDAVTDDTDVVTIGVGIMNSNLLNGLFRICVAQPCGDKILAGEFKDLLPEIANSMTSTIRAVTSRAPRAYIVVVGYPELMPFDNGCKSLPKMDDTQWAYANIAWQQFSTSVGSAARQAGATYVDVRKLSESHAPCTKDPWVNRSSTVKGKRLAYHPNAAEQKAVADAVAAAIRTR